MLSIVTKNGDQQDMWVGYSLENKKIIRKLIPDVDFIQADNDELEILRKLYPYLTPPMRVCRWYGNSAKMLLWAFLA